MKPDNLTHIYGKHAVDLALERRPDALKKVFVAENFADDRILAKVRRSNLSIAPLDTRRLPGSLSRDVNHQGIIAVVDTSVLLQTYKSFLASQSINDKTLILVLAEVQDPHNVGAMIRSAAAFGVDAILFASRNQAPITGAVVKVSAGMAFTVPLVEIKNVNSAIADLQTQGIQVLGLAGEESVSIFDVSHAKTTALVVGNEATGLRQKTRELCDALVRIPMHPRCESLNAAAAVTASLAIWYGEHNR